MKKYILTLAAFSAMSMTQAQVTNADYLRGDTLWNNTKFIKGGKITPKWNDDNKTFTYKVKEGNKDVYYTVDVTNATKSVCEKPEEGSSDNNHKRSDIIVSPDGKFEAYIKDFNIYVKNKQENKEYALSFGGTSQNYIRSIQWAPNSKYIAALQVYAAAERQIPLIKSAPDEQRQPTIHWRNYAKPGDALDIKLPVLYDVENMKQIPLNTDSYRNQFDLYLTGWRNDSREFTFEYNQRGHQNFKVCAVTPEDAKVRNVIDENSDTFIQYYSNYRFDVNDGKQIIWSSQRNGWRHLYMIDGVTGKVVNQITKGDWVVRGVEYVDEANKEIIFKASGINPNEDPYNVHYYRIKFNGKDLVELTPGDANHQATFNSDYTTLVDQYSRPDLPYASVVRDAKSGKEIMKLENSDISDLKSIGWTMPEVFTAKGRDGKTDIWGTIYRPMNFDPNKKYPIIEYIYAGPHDSHVLKDFYPINNNTSALCELGFIVVSIDGMGTANRSKAFHDVCWKNLKDGGFPDRIEWIKSAAKKYPYMDTERVGIYGFSAGGQNAMSALVWHNDFYKVAVSLCGCHDNRMDKIWWNEQWMGYPIDQSYSESSNVDNAWRMKGKLLLINGEFDENVDPTSTLQVVDALMKANKNFEQLYLPSRGHSLGGKFERRKIADFMVKNLLGQDAPEWE